MADGNQYDKLLKEGLRRSVIDLFTLFLGLPEGKYSPQHIEFQKTRERRTDFTFRWEAPGVQRTIVHFEVHGKNEKRLVDRQFDTAALINWHYPSPEWDLIQVVLFIGKRRPTMPTELKKSDYTYRFRLFWVKDFAYRDFLNTGNPYLFLLAALADYEGQSPQTVFLEVVNEARRLLKSDLDFDLFIEQLHMLSNIHNLQQIFNDVYMQLSQLINEKKDPFFQRGKIEGKVEGKIEGEIRGEIRGMSEKTLDFTTNLILHSDHDDEFIARMTDLQPKTVAEIRKIIQDHPSDFRDRLKNLDLRLTIKPKNGAAK